MAGKPRSMRGRGRLGRGNRIFTGAAPLPEGGPLARARPDARHSAAASAPPPAAAAAAAAAQVSGGPPSPVGIIPPGPNPARSDGKSQPRPIIVKSSPHSPSVVQQAEIGNPIIICDGQALSAIPGAVLKQVPPMPPEAIPGPMKVAPHELSGRQHAPNMIPGIIDDGGLHILLPHMTGPGGGVMVGGFNWPPDPSPGRTMAASLGPGLLLAGGLELLLHAATVARTPMTRLVCTALIFGVPILCPGFSYPIRGCSARGRPRVVTALALRLVAEPGFRHDVSCDSPDS